MEQLSFKIRYCPLSTSKSLWNLTVFIILKHSSASSLIAQTNVIFKLRIQLTGLGCWFSLCSFIRNHGPNKRNAVLSCSVCKLLRNSPEAFISISVSSVQAWQCRCKVTLIFFSEGETWHTQSSLPFFFFHQNAVRLLLLPAFKEIFFCALWSKHWSQIFICTLVWSLSQTNQSFFTGFLFCWGKYD